MTFRIIFLALLFAPIFLAALAEWIGDLLDLNNRD